MISRMYCKLVQLWRDNQEDIVQNDADILDTIYVQPSSSRYHSIACIVHTTNHCPHCTNEPLPTSYNLPCTQSRILHISVYQYHRRPTIHPMIKIKISFNWIRACGRKLAQQRYTSRGYCTRHYITSRHMKSSIDRNLPEDICIHLLQAAM